LKNVSTTLIIFLIVVFTFYCGEESTPVNGLITVDIVLQNPVGPDTLWEQTPQYFLLGIEASFPEEKILVESVRAELYNSSNGFISADVLEDKGRRGDLIPKDKIYSAGLNSNEIPGTGTYYFRLTASDAESTIVSNQFTHTITVLPGEKNFPPVLGAIGLPDSIDFDEVENIKVVLSVYDPQGMGDINKVQCLVYFPLSPVADKIYELNDNGTDGDDVQGDGIYTCFFLANEIFYYGEGLYTFLFKAVDNNDNVSELKWKEVRLYSGSGNLPPSVEIMFVPDSIKAEQKVHLFEIRVSDPNGINDIAEVYFNSYKPDGSASSANPVRMYDDGGTTPGVDSGDKAANDGVYSVKIAITPQVGKGNYRFEFFARDWANLLSPAAIKTIVVY